MEPNLFIKHNPARPEDSGRNKGVGGFSGEFMGALREGCCGPAALAGAAGVLCPWVLPGSLGAWFSWAEDLT